MKVVTMKCTTALLIVILFSACLTQTERPRSGPNQDTVVLARQENSKYKLTAIFYGERIGPDTQTVLKHISLRNDATASEAEKEIANHSCYDLIRIYEKSTGTALVHTFGVWSNGEEFRFAAGLSGDTGDFTYNVKTRVLKITGSASNFEGENRYGKVPLSG